MNKKFFVSLFCFFAILSIYPAFVFANEVAQDVRSIELPAPDKAGSVSLMKALAERKSSRNLSNEAVSLQDLSNILWAAWGMNREDGKRTIPTGMNKQKVSLYFADAAGVWIYDAQKHMVHKIIGDDLRAELSNVGLTLAFAVEDGKWGDMHVGSMYQNVGLYCASVGLGNVVRNSGVKVLQASLAPYLPSGYTVRMTQSIGKLK